MATLHELIARARGARADALLRLDIRAAAYWHREVQQLETRLKRAKKKA